MAIKVALDAGHGCDTWERTHGKGVKYDGGKVFEEHTFNAAVVGYTKELLECNGIEVLLTQPLNQKEVSLKARTDLANKQNVKILVSFHADANANANAQGHWVFHWYNSANSKKLTQIWDKFANQILCTPCRGIQESKPNYWTNFHMVRETHMPAILIEHDFMTNAEGLKRLLCDDFRRKCAEVAARAICEYCGVTYKEKVVTPIEKVEVPAPTPEVVKKVDPPKAPEQPKAHDKAWAVQNQIAYLFSVYNGADAAKASWAKRLLEQIYDDMKARKYI